MYKSPRDKLECILICCKVINNKLMHASMASVDNPPGADEFLPVLIYVTIKANPPQLHSNLMYIQRYRRQSRLVAESAYYFTNMLSVESFITNIDAKALSMDEAEYQMNMESARALNLGLAADTSDPPDQNEQNHETSLDKNTTEVKLNVSNLKTEKNHVARPPPSATKSGMTEFPNPKVESSIGNIPSMSDLENKGASMILKEDQLSIIFQEYTYLFAQVGDLTLDDVEFVFKYVFLAKGKGVDPPPLATPFISKSGSQSQLSTLTNADKDSTEGTADENSNEQIEGNSKINEGSDKVSHVPEVKTSDSKSLPRAQDDADHYST